MWVLFGDGVYSSESHTVSQLGLLLLKHDVVGQILYFSAASQHAVFERADSSRHSLPVPMSVVATSC